MAGAIRQRGLSSPEGALIHVAVTTVQDTARHDRQLPRNGFSMRQQYRADSVREVLPVPVERVGPSVGLARRRDETMRDFNELQDIKTPTPAPSESARLC